MRFCPLLIIACLLIGFAQPMADASTLTWTGGGDGATFDQLTNWSGTPTGGAINVGDLVDTYVVDDPTATITGITQNLCFHDGGGLEVSAGSLNALSSGSYGMGTLESPASFGMFDMSGGSVSSQFLAELTVSLGGNASLTLGGADNPVNESTIDFTGTDAQIHFLNETTADFISEHLGKVTVSGSTAIVGINLDVVSDGGSGSFVSSLGPTESNVQLFVDRDTGGLTLANNTGQPIEFIEYDILSQAGGLDETQWTSVAGHYDAATNGGNGSVDPDDDWFRFTAPGGRTDLAEGSLGEATLAHGQSVDLGNAWIASPFEDLVATLALTDGTDLVVNVEYSGTVLSDPVVFGDFNADGTIDAVDWPSLRAHLLSSAAGMLAVDAHAAGDMNSDGLVDEIDFDLFKTEFDAAYGAGAFDDMLSGVPEPSSWIIFCLGFIVCPWFARRK